MSKRSAINQDAVRRSGESISSGASSALSPSLASLQFTVLNATIVAPIFLSASSADRNLLDRSYEIIKQSGHVSFSVNVIANTATGNTLFSVTNAGVSQPATLITVPAGATGIFVLVDIPIVFLVQEHVDVLVDTVTAVGSISAACLVNLNP